MRVTPHLPHALGTWLVGNQNLYVPQRAILLCNNSIMAAEQLRERCFADSQKLHSLIVALGYKNRALQLYHHHPLDYLFVILFTTGSKCSLVS